MEFVLIGLLILAFPIIAIVALVKSVGQGDRLRQLESRFAALEARLAGSAAPAAAAEVAGQISDIPPQFREALSPAEQIPPVAPEPVIEPSRPQAEEPPISAPSAAPAAAVPQPKASF